MTNPYESPPSDILDPASQRKFRWRIIPVTLTAIISAMNVMGSISLVLVIFAFYQREFVIEDSSSATEIYKEALATWITTPFWILSTVAWYRWNWKVATFLTVVALAGGGILRICLP